MNVCKSDAMIWWAAIFRRGEDGGRAGPTLAATHFGRGQKIIKIREIEKRNNKQKNSENMRRFEPRRFGGATFRCFSYPPSQLSFFLFSVEVFWWKSGRGSRTSPRVRVWAPWCHLVCEPWRPQKLLGLHNIKQRVQTCIWESHGTSKNTTNNQRKDPQRGKYGATFLRSETRK